MKGLVHRFGFRVTAVIVLSILSVVILCDILIYQFSFKSQFEATRQRLTAIAQTAALIIDADKITEIPLYKEGSKTPAYAYVADQLKKIKAANRQIKFIYILTRTDGTNIWRFVADADNGVTRGRWTLPGDTYDAGRFPQLVEGFNRPSADKKIESDEWGKTLSGYAPIRDRIGRPIAVLGVDISAEDIYAMRNEVAFRSVIILLIGIVLAFLVGALVSKRVADPINELIAGTSYIAQGNLHHQVYVAGEDEIAELARSFNKMTASLNESRVKLINYFYDTVKALVMVLEIRDHYTLGHSESVAAYAVRIAQRMGIEQRTLEMFKRVALLHDIGKVGVRDSVLLKPDKLDEDEWDAIKIHPVLGEQILKPILNDPIMLQVVRNHHERIDGKGYPDGLKGDQIPLLVAITTVADSYDAMTSTRAYRRALSPEQAVEQLVKNRGTQFHPDVVDTFLIILEEDKKIPKRTT